MPGSAAATGAPCPGDSSMAQSEEQQLPLAESVRRVLRDEFRSLQQRLVDEVRAELAQRGQARTSAHLDPSNPRVRSPRARTQSLTAGGGLVMAPLPSKFNLPKSSRVAEYQEWLREVGEVWDQKAPRKPETTAPLSRSESEVGRFKVKNGGLLEVDLVSNSVREFTSGCDTSEDDGDARDTLEAARADAAAAAPDAADAAAHPHAPELRATIPEPAVTLEAERPKPPSKAAEKLSKTLSKLDAAPQKTSTVSASLVRTSRATEVALRETRARRAQGRCSQGQAAGAQEAAWKRLAERAVRSHAFEVVSMLVIFLSALHIGWQTDHMARHVLEAPPIAFRAFDLVFLVYFFGELLLKLAAHRSRFFSVYGWQWHVLDTILVGGQMLEELLASALESNSGLSSALLRIIRVLRSARVVRIAHATKFAEELRLLVSCVAHSSRSFHWAAALISLMIYIVGVHITQFTLTYRLDLRASGMDAARVEAEMARLGEWYGTVPRSVLSLFQGLTGGVDWNDLVAPLIDQISPWAGLLFSLYMAFAIIAVMNVITGTFVQYAMERAQHINELRKVSQATTLFRTIDQNQDGWITFNEFERHLESVAVKNFFQSIDVDVSEARCVFDLLDSDNSGRIPFNDFLGGCMRLQGPAKAIDLVLVMRWLKESGQAGDIL